MTALSLSFRLLRAVLLFVLMIGMTARAAVPDGYMLERSDETGVMQVRLCGAGLGERFASFDPVKGAWVSHDESDGAKSDNDADRNTPYSCDFALSMIADLPAQDVWSGVETFGLPLLGGRIYVSESHAPIIQAPLPARGPPRSPL